MVDWFEDPWIKFALYMVEDFFSYHNEKMPEDADNVWNEKEFVYFCYVFSLYAAQLKFGRKAGKQFDVREGQYKDNIKKEIDYTNQNPIEGDDQPKASFDEYLQREQEYLPLLYIGASSVLSALSGSPFKKACKPFVTHACKRHIFSNNDLIKIVHSWLLDKGIEFEKNVLFE